ncbi:hypothetical protein PHYC_01062 [Phycisphaerales bacterium]|nr:hypothetical protein PHYC_01062 [Phycisphaerales bacterium]
MRRSNVIALTLAGAAGLFVSASALAQPMVSATYFDLSGNWNGALFNAHATDAGALHSSGSVARLVAPTGTADFEPGFVSGANPADFFLNLSFVPAGPGLGTGSGFFSIIDADGSFITGAIDGFWIDDTANPPGQVYFNGTLSGVVFGGPTFDGTNGGSFSTIFGGTPPYDGAITQLYLAPPGNFFVTPFADVPTGVTMQILPAPGALALMGLGGLVATRRRR